MLLSQSQCDPDSWFTHHRYTRWWRRMCVNNLPRVVTFSGIAESKSWPFKSDILTIHCGKWRLLFCHVHAHLLIYSIAIIPVYCRYKQLEWYYWKCQVNFSCVLFICKPSEMCCGRIYPWTEWNCMIQSIQRVRPAVELMPRRRSGLMTSILRTSSGRIIKEGVCSVAACYYL